MIDNYIESFFEDDNISLDQIITPDLLFESDKEVQEFIDNAFDLGTQEEQIEALESFLHRCEAVEQYEWCSMIVKKIKELK